MIKESLYFTFAGKKSSDFGIINVSVDSGLFKESLIANRTRVETDIKGRRRRLLTEVQREPITIPLTFYFEETWNEALIDEICEWLDVDHYEPLGFDENFDRLFNAMPVDSLDLVHNGLKQGYVTLNMGCDSAYSYSPVIEKGYDFSDNEDEAMFEIHNSGHLDIEPILEITMLSSGDVSILNLNSSSSEFVLKGLNSGEIITVDCENYFIDSSHGINRYDSFNHNYLSIPYGYNRFLIKGKCLLQLKYQYTYKSLTL